MSAALATGGGGSLPESAILAIPDSPDTPGKIPQTMMRSHFAHGSQKNLRGEAAWSVLTTARTLGDRMRVGWRRWMIAMGASLLLGALAPAAWAQVSVTIDGNTAVATISLDGNGTTYEADVTIVFDTPLNLSAQSLNLTVELVDPAQIQARLPQDQCPILLGPPCVTVDPSFPVMITVEPPVLPWLFASGFDNSEDGSGSLSFINTYAFEVHTHDLTYTTDSPYRLFKAPLGGNFYDITNDVLEGSVRARGRGPAFSQFLVVSDVRSTCGVALGKIVELDLRILAAAISDGLRGDLLALLTKVQTLLFIDLDAAIASLDALIADIDAHAGTDIANVWRAERDLVNDAGEMNTQAKTLRFTLVRAQAEGLLACLL